MKITRINICKVLRKVPGYSRYLFPPHPFSLYYNGSERGIGKRMTDFFQGLRGSLTVILLWLSGIPSEETSSPLTYTCHHSKTLECYIHLEHWQVKWTLVQVLITTWILQYSYNWFFLPHVSLHSRPSYILLPK